MHSSQSNIYDSWRSQGGHQVNHPHPSQYYYDSYNGHLAPQAKGFYPLDDYREANMSTNSHNSVPMYTYNPRRINRKDYNDDF